VRRTETARGHTTELCDLEEIEYFKFGIMATSGSQNNAATTHILVSWKCDAIIHVVCFCLVNVHVTTITSGIG